MESPILILLGLVATVVFVYILVRVASFAFFRTKLEYFRSFLKEINKGRQ